MRLGLCDPEAVLACPAVSCSLKGFQSSWGGRADAPGKVAQEFQEAQDRLVGEWLTRMEDRGCGREGRSLRVCECREDET